MNTQTQQNEARLREASDLAIRELEGVIGDAEQLIIHTKAAIVQIKMKQTAPEPLCTSPAHRPKYSEQDWPEDFGHENYYSECAQCKQTFIGHKRRCICRKCATIPEPGKHWAEAAFESWSIADPHEYLPYRDTAFLAGVKAGLLHAKGSLCYPTEVGANFIFIVDMKTRLQQAADSVPEGK